jgi:nicotinamidase/pyrazinamidase
MGMGSLNLNAQTDAVLAVDVQRGFMPGEEPGYGELPAPGGDRVAAPLAALAGHVGIFAATGDSHPADHSSFTAQGGIWPVHCVAGTPGARLHPLIEKALTPGWFFAKGTTRETDAYSAFAVTDLAERLRRAGIRRLVVGGLVTNVCVLASAMDALAAGFEVVVLTDACAAVKADGVPTGEEALAQLREAGATLATSGELLGG